MKKNSKLVLIIFTLTLIAIFIAGGYFYSKTINNQIVFILPLNNSMYPADNSSPNFYVNDSKGDSIHLITINVNDWDSPYIDTMHNLKWSPDLVLWQKIKNDSKGSDVKVTVNRIRKESRLFNQTAILKFSVSSDSVNASILYRQLPLPFAFAESNIWLASYSLKNIANEGPYHDVLSSFETCGNCHSLSHNGSKIALDFDAVSRDKGGYFISKMDSVVKFDTSNYISWSKLTGRNTFGLLSRISFDGRYIVTTVKDRVISEKTDFQSDKYSQLFFPINGVLAVYDTELKTLKELPGANDTSYVQSNAVWTPDNKYIIFARAKAIPFAKDDSIYDCFMRDKVFVYEYVMRRRTYKYDLYKIPYNGGKGGVAEPIEGASFNGKSNYFPTISPDGKWIAFCQAESFMMLQPDSRIFIVPISGGKAKKLKCNFNSMNSWHSWSPNGKWLLFTTKILDSYTDMFITHIDGDGNASVPVLIENAKKHNCAINYPEFVNCDKDFKFRMDYQYINFYNIDKLIVKKKFKEAQSLLLKYINQMKKGTPVEYIEIARISHILGDVANFKKYSDLARKAHKEFSRIR